MAQSGKFTIFCNDLRSYVWDIKIQTEYLSQVFARELILYEKELEENWADIRFKPNDGFGFVQTEHILIYHSTLI